MQPPLEPDPVIEAYKRGLDRTLIRENLKRTPTERLERLMELQRFTEELQRAGREARWKRRYFRRGIPDRGRGGLRVRRRPRACPTLYTGHSPLDKEP